MCEAYPGKGSMLVMNNSCTHHGHRILELVEQFGEYMHYLGSFSHGV